MKFRGTEPDLDLAISKLAAVDLEILSLRGSFVVEDDLLGKLKPSAPKDRCKFDSRVSRQQILELIANGNISEFETYLILNAKALPIIRTGVNWEVYESYNELVEKYR